MSKYHNRKMVVDGYTFDSRAEGTRYLELSLMQKAGEIHGLRVHPVYTLLDAFTFRGKHVRAIKYEADFSYIEDGVTVIEDVKGGRATQTRAFGIKLKMLQHKLRDDAQYEIRVVMQ